MEFVRSPRTASSAFHSQVSQTLQPTHACPLSRSLLLGSGQMGWGLGWEIQGQLTLTLVSEAWFGPWQRGMEMMDGREHMAASVLTRASCLCLSVPLVLCQGQPLPFEVFLSI